MKKESQKFKNQTTLSEIVSNQDLKPQIFLRNLEECLNNFISEKSNSSTPNEIPEVINVVSEPQSIKENYASISCSDIEELK